MNKKVVRRVAIFRCVSFLLALIGLVACKPSLDTKKAVDPVATEESVPNAPTVAVPGTVTPKTTPTAIVGLEEIPTPTTISQSELPSVTITPTSTLATLDDDNPLTPILPVPGQPVTFTMKTGYQTPPPDIVLEIIAYIMAGGPPQKYCGSYSEPTLMDRLYRSRELFPRQIQSFVCGWDAREVVKLTIEIPDGTTEVKTLHAQSPGTWLADNSQLMDGYGTLLFYSLNFGDPTGMYRLHYRGTSGEIEDYIKVFEHPGPRLYRKGNLLHLYNFEPGERVRLFAYTLQQRQGTWDTFWTFEVWQLYQVDDLGQLDIVWAEDIINRTFIAIGEISGEVTDKSTIDSILAGPE